MRVLVLEGVSGFHEEVDRHIFPEGFAMLSSMIGEFEDAGFETITVLNEGASEFESWLAADSVFARENLDEVLEQNIDAALVIGPGPELPEVVGRVREREIPVLGPEGSSFEVASDKWETYRTLDGEVPHPNTWKNFDEAGLPVVAKPRFGVGSSDVELISERSKDYPSEKIFEEYIEGSHVSACVLANGKDSLVLSVNEQDMEIDEDGFSYRGGKVPYVGDMKKSCAEIALEAVDILDMSGLCGVDMVLGEDVYFIELNPRVTTSFVGLAPLLSDSLGRMLVDTLINGKSVPKPDLEGYSAIKIPWAEESVEIDRSGIDEIKGVQGIISPPFALNGYVEGGSPLFLAAEQGENSAEVERKLDKKIRKAIDLLGIESDAVSWP